MKNKSFAKRFLKAYISCAVVILSFLIVMIDEEETNND